jgi:uncharacterized protein (DUF983 family)
MNTLHDVRMDCPQCGGGCLEFNLKEHRVRVHCESCDTSFIFESIGDWNRLSDSERLD